jgi:RNA polymerase sigma-70 factor (ECF subfamily)
MTDWREIVAKHGSVVWRTAYRVLNHHADALECYQDTFLAAWQFVERRSVDDWASFLVCLATRRATDRLRRRYRERSRFRSIDADIASSAGADCPIRGAIASELMDRVRAGMAELPPKQAEVFWLSCVEGLSHQDIGIQLRISSGEVRVLLHRARSHLREALDLRLQDRKEER